MSAREVEAGYDQALREIRTYAETRGITLAKGITATQAIAAVVDMVADHLNPFQGN